jgi:hypothetical protein
MAARRAGQWGCWRCKERYNAAARKESESMLLETETHGQTEQSASVMYSFINHQSINNQSIIVNHRQINQQSI